MLGKEGGKPLARAIAPAGDDHALALTVQALDMRHARRRIHSAFGLRARRRRSALAVPPKDTIVGARLLWMLEGVERDHLAAGELRSAIPASLRNRLSGGTG